jgi:oligopeptide/dipeptide ABC transporter ATP-binding protein
MNPKAKDHRVVLQGEVPSPIDMPTGCAFSSRCPAVMDVCKIERPTLRISNISKGEHLVACHLNKGEK